MKEVLVKGYLILDHEQELNETLFALYPDGTVKKCIRKFSTSFFRKQDTWIDCSKVNVDAEYCGQYRTI